MPKFIVITGVTSGLGKELVKLYSQDFSNVIFAGYRDKYKLERQRPKNVIYFEIDMRDRDSIVKAAEFIRSKTSRIDTLINVAGCVTAGPIEKIDTKKLREQFDVNTFSHLEFTQNLLPAMRGSKIINISSMASYGQFPFISPYCASKRSLDIFFNALALENHKNIQVISVKPGVIATPLWKKSVDANQIILQNCSGYDKELKFLKENALKNSHRGLKVETVAKFIRWIDSNKYNLSSYVIGWDALLAAILSILPQDLINLIIRYGMQCKLDLSKSLVKKI